MSTNYSPIEAKNALLAVMTTALATSSSSGGQVQVHYAHEPSAEEECVFFGRPAVLEGGDEYIGRTSINANRLAAEPVVPVSASYSIEGTCWSFRPDLTPSDAAAAEARIDAIWTALDAAFASLSWVGEQSVDFQVRPYQSGWVALAPFTVQVLSFLT